MLIKLVVFQIDREAVEGLKSDIEQMLSGPVEVQIWIEKASLISDGTIEGIHRAYEAAGHVLKVVIAGPIGKVALGAAGKALADMGVKWAVAHFKAEGKKTTVKIYGPDDKVIKTIEFPQE